MLGKIRIPGRAWTLIHLALIVWTGWLAAGLADMLVADAILPNDGAVAPVYTPETSGRPVVKSDYSLITGANIFDPSHALKEPTEPSTGAPISPDTPVTSLDLKLIGTAIDPSGEYRLAAIELSKPADQHLYRLNDEVEGAVIVSIERNRVGLMNNGRMEILQVDFAQKPSGASLSRVKGLAKAYIPGREVIKRGEGEYLVSRRYVDSQLKNMNRLITEVRAVPNVDKSGVTNGFKLFSIKNGSLFNKIGLRNHDVVQKVNGVELDSAEKGLELFQALRNETSFEVDVLRQRRKTTLRFNIQ